MTKREDLARVIAEGIDAARGPDGRHPMNRWGDEARAAADLVIARGIVGTGGQHDETYDEWHLTGQPTSTRPDVTYPPYEFTTHDPKDIDAIRLIHRKVVTGKHQPWERIELRRRHVTITRTEWETIELDPTD